jgi:molybdate transport system ATP-binding protein
VTSFALSVDAKIDLGAEILEVALEVDGHAIALRGPSGSGKSTFLRALAGVERRADGEIAAFGEQWQDSKNGVFLSASRRRVGWVPQNALLFPHLSVAENLGYAGATTDAVHKMAKDLEVEALLSRQPRRLSGGEAQRVALGRALLANPRLLLLDEPFAALDGALKERMTAVVEATCEKQGLSIVLATHDDQISALLCEHRFQIMDGRVIAIAD